MKTFFGIAALLLASCLAEDATNQQIPDNSCASKFKDDPKRANVSEACITKIGLKPEDMPPTEEEFAKTFNDKVGIFYKEVVNC